MKVAIDGTVQEVKSDELLIDLINRTGGSVPHACYHPQLGPAQTFDTWMVGVNGRLARTCATQSRMESAVGIQFPSLFALTGS